MVDVNGNSLVRKLVAALIVGVIAIVFLYGSVWWGPNVSLLTERALEGSAEEQVEAAQELSAMGAIEALRIVLAETQNPNVASVCMLGVARQLDYESMDTLIARLDDKSVRVRAAAATALTKMLGRKYHFPADGKEAERSAIKKQIEKDWQEYSGSELFEFNKKRFKDKS